MVRNIYAELCKTADYRDRLEIEKYATQSKSMWLLKCCSSSFYEDMIIKLAKGRYEKNAGCSMKPAIKGTDHAIWKQTKLILFTTKIAEDRRDILSRNYVPKSPVS
jgi:hypothetical protein